MTPANGQIAPHGGRLVNRLASPAQAVELRKRLGGLPRVTLNARTLSLLDLLAVGAYSPLDGFLGQADYESVLDRMRLANGLPWSIPITLGVTPAQAESLREGEEVALADEAGRVIGVLNLRSRYERQTEREAAAVYRTTEDAHPGVAALRRQGTVLLTGPVTVLERRPLDRDFADVVLDPAETRHIFAERGWRTVAGFQTRNPIHRAHEYLTKVALEVTDGLLLHPLVGETKSDDVPADVRLRCYRELFAHYYPHDRVQLAALPAPMHYAGPREAILHALIRKNYGCTHFIVGRDHAGVGNYYGTYDSQPIFSEFAPGELGITPLFFEHAFYCRACGSMATTKSCPHDGDSRVILSGTKVRELLRAGQLPPPEFSRPEVARILVSAMASNGAAQPVAAGDDD
ncbi:MAG: sulfate adenylyltransferase [Thermomicrobiales bacterium]